MSDELEPRVKIAINAYLFKWLAAIGIVNILAILTGFAYIFLVLPKKATTEAVVLVQAEIQSLRNQLISATGTALEEAGRAQGIAEATTTNANNAQVQIEKLKREISAVEQDGVAQVGRVIQLLKGDPRLDVSLDLSARVVAVEQALAGAYRSQAFNRTVSWKDLVGITSVENCSNPGAVTSGACLAAANRFCLYNQGAVSGFMTEHTSDEVQITCVQ